MFMATDLPQNFAWVESMKKYEGNPIIRPHGKWAADLFFNPAAIVKDDQVLLLCRCVNLADKRRGKKCASTLTTNFFSGETGSTGLAGSAKREAAVTARTIPSKANDFLSVCVSIIIPPEIA